MMDWKQELPGLAQEMGFQRRGWARPPVEKLALSQELVQAQQEAHLSIATNVFNHFDFWMLAVPGNTAAHMLLRQSGHRLLCFRAVRLIYHGMKAVIKLISQGACVSVT